MRRGWCRRKWTGIGWKLPGDDSYSLGDPCWEQRVKWLWSFFRKKFCEFQAKTNLKQNFNLQFRRKLQIDQSRILRFRTRFRTSSIIRQTRSSMTLTMSHAMLLSRKRSINFLFLLLFVFLPFCNSDNKWESKRRIIKINVRRIAERYRRVTNHVQTLFGKDLFVDPSCKSLSFLSDESRQWPLSHSASLADPWFIALKKVQRGGNFPFRTH